MSHHMRCPNFQHLWFTQGTIFQALYQGACSSSVAYQCVCHIIHWSCADKCIMGNIGCLYWDNNDFVGVPSFPVSRSNDVRNILGGFWQMWSVIDVSGSHWRGYHNLFGHLIQGWSTSSSAAHTTEPTGQYTLILSANPTYITSFDFGVCFPFSRCCLSKYTQALQPNALKSETSLFCHTWLGAVASLYALIIGRLR